MRSGMILWTALRDGFAQAAIQELEKLVNNRFFETNVIFPLRPNEANYTYAVSHRDGDVYSIPQVLIPGTLTPQYEDQLFPPGVPPAFSQEFVVT